MMPDRAQFRDTTRYLAAVASELGSPFLRAYANARVGRPAADAGAWRKGLILGSGHIGDVLYRTCSLDHLARSFPSCEWSYLTTAEGAELLRGNAAVNEILPLMESSARGGAPPWIGELRARNFDVALCTDNIEHHHDLWLATRLGIPSRVAFTQKGFSGLATIRVRTFRAPWPFQIRTMFNAIAGSEDTSPLRPRIHPAPADHDAARREWDGLDNPSASLTIAASVTSRQQLGVFPPSLFSGILRHVIALRPDARVVLCGSSADASQLGEVATALGARAQVRAGTLGLRAFAAFLSLCDGFLGADSGPRHIANAADIPVFFVRNLAVPEIEAGKYCDTETDLAPAGQYLSNHAAQALLESVDQQAAAIALIGAADRRSRSRLG